MSLLLRLWTKAVGTPGYEKSEWKRLAAAVEARHRLYGQDCKIAGCPGAIGPDATDRPMCYGCGDERMLPREVRQLLRDGRKASAAGDRSWGEI